MRSKNYGSLLVASLIVCMIALALLGGAPATSSSPLANSSRGTSSSGNLQCLHDIGLYDQNISIINKEAIRTIDVEDFGLVEVNDTVIVFNNSSSTASYWTFYLPSDAYSSLRYIAAYGNGTTLSVSVAPPFESFFGMRADFGIGGLRGGSSIKVTLIQEYSGLVKPLLASGSTQANLYFYKFLTSPYITYNYTTLIYLPDSATTNEASSITSSTVCPFNCTRLGSSPDGSYDYQLAGGQTLLEVNVNRLIEINIDGYISVTETHSITNLGPQSFSNIEFIIPLSPIPGSLVAYDSSGELSISSEQNVTSNIEDVSLRYSVAVNSSYTYYVSYRAYTDSYMTFQNGLSVLQMSPVTLFNCSVSSELTTIILPPHFQLYNASLHPSQITAQGDSIVIAYSFQGVTLLNTPPIELKYSEYIADTFERPMILSFGFFIIGLLYVAIRKIFPRGEVVKVSKEAEEKVRGVAADVKEFCSNFEEKTALTLEMEKLAEDRRKGRISKRAYLERLQLGRRRIATLTNIINEEKKKLVPASKRYASIIRQLDTFEEERENAKASLENLELRRRQGKVPGDVYNNLKYDNTRKIEKATAGIDSLIVQFRQEAM